MRTMSVVGVLGVSFLLFSPVVHAEIIQEVQVSLNDTSGNRVDADSDSVTGLPILDPILAQISSMFEYEAVSAAGPFGNVGVEATQSVAGALRTRVEIFSDENVNNTGIAQSAVANFIIDGGEIFMLAALGSTVEFQVNLESIVKVGGSVVDRRSFQGGGQVETASDFGPVSLRSFGADLGAFIDPLDPLRVEIPFSFQSFDLGIIPPGGIIELTYILDIFSDTPISPEGIFWQFSDPGNVSGFEEFPTVAFSSVSAQVPEPSTLTLWSLGAVGLIGLGRRRRKRVA